jgi:hypothetical protein
MFFFSKKDPIVTDMQATLHKLESKDAATLRALDADTESTLAGLALEQKR